MGEKLEEGIQFDGACFFLSSIPCRKSLTLPSLPPSNFLFPHTLSLDVVRDAQMPLKHRPAPIRFLSLGVPLILCDRSSTHPRLWPPLSPDPGTISSSNSSRSSGRTITLLVPPPFPMHNHRPTHLCHLPHYRHHPSEVLPCQLHNSNNTINNDRNRDRDRDDAGVRPICLRGRQKMMVASAMAAAASTTESTTASTMATSPREHKAMVLVVGQRPAALERLGTVVRKRGMPWMWKY